MATALGAIGCVVDLVFVGDPANAATESKGNVTLRRWAQGSSAHHPRNAYDGEREKIADWESSLPSFVVDQIVAPTAASGERTLVICEEWQTAGVAIVIDQLARLRGVRPSEGDGGLYERYGPDGYDVIEWTAAQPFCDGQVGMAGQLAQRPVVVEQQRAPARTRETRA